jgi:ankyrin repeat protein
MSNVFPVRELMPGEVNFPNENSGTVQNQCEKYYTLAKNSNSKKDYGTPLMFAVTENNLDCVKRLAGQGDERITNINKQNAIGINSLHIASINGYYSVVEWLLANGANRLLQDEKGLTALHYAAINDELSTVQLLADKDSITIKDNNGQTALEVMQSKLDSEHAQVFTADIVKFLKQVIDKFRGGRRTRKRNAKSKTKSKAKSKAKSKSKSKSKAKSKAKTR